MADDYKPIEKGKSQLIKRSSGRGRFLGPKTDLTSFDYSKVGRAHVDHIDNKYQTGFTANRKEKDPTEFVDVEVEAQYDKLDVDEGQLIKRDIGERYIGSNVDAGFVRGGIATKVQRQAEDQKRIAKFLTTPKGALFTIKQAILQNQNADRETNIYNPLSLNSSLIDTLTTRPQRHINEAK